MEYGDPALISEASLIYGADYPIKHVVSIVVPSRPDGPRLVYFWRVAAKRG